jgi:hypothetical protein
MTAMSSSPTDVQQRSAIKQDLEPEGFRLDFDGQAAEQ